MKKKNLKSLVLKKERIAILKKMSFIRGGATDWPETFRHCPQDTDVCPKTDKPKTDKPFSQQTEVNQICCV